RSLDPLRSACAVRIEAMPPSRAELLRWGAARLARDTIVAESGALEAVTEACEGDPLAFFSEMEKLCAAIGPSGRLSKTETVARRGPVVGADVPEYLAGVALGQPGAAAQRLGRLLAAGVSEGTLMFSLANLVGGALGGWSRHPELSGTLRRRLRPRAPPT